MNMYSLRPTELEDIEGIQRTARESWFDTYREIYTTAFIESFLEKAYAAERLESTILRDGNRETRTFIVAADQDNQIVGFAQAAKDPEQDKRFELLRIYLKPGFQGQGLGTQLLKYYSDKLPEMESLIAWVELENRIGRRFYECKGFTMKEMKEEELFGYRTTLICYEKRR